ncbi:tRNA(Met) cytidine acetate ligase [Oribacterium sp. WCC10]|uniref:tRNA(Met) cytidine acetate ligase n=1 Tax=Oribacterium sp. WCC10 TaxID=1855343 RepID=UPI0008E93185|nr:nucleotidyltransferase family protein [Oribacterium sp. WCC10]SFG07412.1 Predicted nucleotidyltransferase [Oribacterium sp. WCC10]
MFNEKNVIGIVTEFNPFHEGHRYLVNSIRLRYGDCYIVAAMSGDFVQRGEPAIFDKYERTWDALYGGVDMVVQIPEIFSTSSAEDFAAGGVAVLRSLGIVDTILFGSESGDLEVLKRIADIELDTGSKDNAKLNAAIRDNVAAGMSYAKARAEAVRLVLTGDDENAFEKMLDDVCKADIIHDGETRNSDEKLSVRAEAARLKPNDILGVEYIKAVKRQGDCFRVDCIRRNMQYESAHSIRDAIRAGEETEREYGSYAEPDMLSEMLGYRLIQLYYVDQMDPEQPSSFMEYLDVSREIADALKKQVHDRLTFSERIREIKSKNYTYTRISRALLHIVLDIHKKDSRVLRGRFFGSADVMPYVRVLGVKKSARDILGVIKTSVVTSPAKYKKQLEAVRRKETIETPEELILSINASHAEIMFNQDMYAADIYNQLYSHGKDETSSISCGNEFAQKFIVVDG